jgi:hypothetical protein
VREEVQSRLTLYPKETEGMKSDDPRIRDTVSDGIVRHLGFFYRHSGTGEYAGVLVGLLALFALANTWRGPDTPFSPNERRAVWFWGATALISVMVAWGRYGFLYSLLYRVPYFSTIRNPIKFLHPFHLSWLILAGYGLETLHRRYLQAIVKKTGLRPENRKSWWSRTAGFEKKWMVGSALAVAASVAGFVVLVCSKDRLIEYLVDIQYLVDYKLEVDRAPQLAGFCVSEAAWFVFFLVLSAGAVAAILSGAWSGARARWAWLFLGAVLVADLGRSDLPWIRYYDYQEKYASNDVLDFLASKKPYEQRVVGRLSPRGPGSANGGSVLGQAYNFWMQNEFPQHDIQTLDFAQMSRMPVLDDAYLRNFILKGTDPRTADLQPSARLWELTGTRYILLDKNVGTNQAGVLVPTVWLLNEHGDPLRHGFRLVAPLRIHFKAGVQYPDPAGDMTADKTADNDPRGIGGLMEFDHVLPRAKLFANWRTPTNDEATLATLLSTNFNPAQTVLLATNTTVEQAPGDPNADAGAVEITDYKAREIKLHADAKTPAVLLLNDRFAETWSVWVDQKPARLLRCNYIMRGVFLAPGGHTVEFRYRPDMTTLFLSLGGWAAGLALAGYLVCGRRRQDGALTAAGPSNSVKGAR